LITARKGAVSEAFFEAEKEEAREVGIADAAVCCNVI
jgi:hypothetical protein